MNSKMKSVVKLVVGALIMLAGYALWYKFEIGLALIPIFIGGIMVGKAIACLRYYQ